MMFKLEYKHTHCRGFWCYFYFFKSFTSANSEFGRFGIWVLAFSANSSSVFFFFFSFSFFGEDFVIWCYYHVGISFFSSDFVSSNIIHFQTETWNRNKRGV